jgi:hypothetical protein
VEKRSGGGSKTDVLAAAGGYAVFDLRGRRIGLAIELVDDPESGGQRLAIRRDGVFLWHRRLLPLDAIETIDVERRLIVVAEDREPAKTTATREEADDNLLERMGAYTHPESVLDQGERPVPLPAHAASNRYLRFVSTPTGYRLEEQDGQPPAVGTLINGIDLPERFIVVKLGPSPLPNDPRVCAFLEREITLVV